MPRIVAEKGPDRGSTWSIQKHAVLLIGRDNTAQISLRDEEISRRHCQIECRDDVCLIRDLESTNGVLVNGEEISEPTTLRHNDHIEVGITRLTFLTDDDPLLGSEIGGCQVEQRIGRGGMGTVYRARQKSLDRPIALKILSDKYTRNPQFISLFIREARSAGRLSHPHIVQVYDVGKEDSHHYFTMELVAGGSVEKVIDESGALPLDQALRCARDAATGLEYAEKMGVVHRDIKPGNLMISSNGAVKIGDLGIARTTDESGVASQKDGVSGSPHYIAPEQARGDSIDQRADIYSLGATLFHCLAGRTPYRGAGAREVILKHIQATTPPDLAEVAPQVPAEVVQLVARMMDSNRDQRPANARVLGEELDQLLQDHGSRGIDGSVGNSGPSRLKLLIFLVILVGSVAGWMQWQNNQDEKTRAAQQTAQYFDAVSKSLDLADSAVSRGDPVGAEELLESIKKIPLDLQPRVTDLELAIETEHQRVDALSREEGARSHLADILSATQQEMKPAQKLQQLLELVDSHPGTRAGERAKVLAQQLKLELQQASELEDRALFTWQEALARAEGWRSSRNPARAREEALTLSENFASTEAWQQRNLFLELLTSEAIILWAEASTEVKTLLDEGRFAQAEDIIDGVVTRALLPETRDLEPQLRAEVSKARKAAAAVRTPEIGPVLREGWSAFNRSFSGRESSSVLRDAALRDGLPESSMLVIDHHHEFLEQFDLALASLPPIDLPQRSGRLIEGSASGDVAASIVRIEKDRVIYRDTEEQVGRYLLWKEVAPGSRLDLWIEAGPPAEMLIYITLLLEWAERKEEATPLWQRIAPETVPRLRQMLRETRD